MRPNEWEDLYRSAFRRVYPALVVTLLDRDAALDALHDAFVEGISKPPADRRNEAGSRYFVADPHAIIGHRVDRGLSWVIRPVPD